MFKNAFSRSPWRTQHTMAINFTPLSLPLVKLEIKLALVVFVMTTVLVNPALVAMPS